MTITKADIDRAKRVVFRGDEDDDDSYYYVVVREDANYYYCVIDEKIDRFLGYQDDQFLVEYYYVEPLPKSEMVEIETINN